MSISKTNNRHIAIEGIDGCGKSTLLRCLNMLEKPTSGKIILDNEDIQHIIDAYQNYLEVVKKDVAKQIWKLTNGK